MSWLVRFRNREVRRRDERGSGSIEAVLVAIALGLFIALVILGGRVEMAKQAVQSAAYDAARSASISRTSGEANSSGQSTAMASLSQQGIHCTRFNVTIHMRRGGETHTVELFGCRIKKLSDAHQQGTDALKRKAELHVMGIVRDNQPPYPEFRRP